MGAITHSIEVNAPLERVYDQWTQFGEFPRFMEGVDEVRQVGVNQLFWKAKIAGIEKQWEAEISEQVPNERVAWQSVGGTPNKGAVTFEPLDVFRTRVTLTMEYEPEGILEKAGDALGIPFSEVQGDLNRFREFMENGGSETRPIEAIEGSSVAENVEIDSGSANVFAPTYEQIAHRAYELYLERGETPGDEREDWRRAEKELSERAHDW